VPRERVGDRLLVGGPRLDRRDRRPHPAVRLLGGRRSPAHQFGQLQTLKQMLRTRIGFRGRSSRLTLASYESPSPGPGYFIRATLSDVVDLGAG